MRDLTIPFAIKLIISIQQVQIHTTNCYFPQICLHGATRIRNLNHHVAAVLLFHLRDRQVAEVLRLIVGNLLSFRTESLCEIAVTIEETDSGHVNVAVGSLFDVVTGEDTQTTRVDLEHMRQTVLHREISDRRFFLVLRCVHVFAELSIYLVQLLHELSILGQLNHAVVADDVQQHDRVRVGTMPCIVVDVAEQILCVSIPAPPYVVRNFLQFAQLCRKSSVYVALFPCRLIHITYFYFHR